jgi:putative ABC transport system ATP-binding protein
MAPQQTPPLITLEGVTKVYGQGQASMKALRGIDLSIAPGEFVAVMGPSGSGKSTCMNIIGCLDTPTDGRYLFEGVDVGSLSRDQRALLRRNYLGFVFQGFNLLNRTSALENVELPLIYRGLPAAERHQRAREALRQVGLEGWEHHTPGELSGGQQQRVAIARAIVTRPAIVLADEPTANVDSVTADAILDLMQKLNREEGITFLFSTHDQRLMERTRRLITMHDGRIEHDEIRR